MRDKFCGKVITGCGYRATSTKSSYQFRESAHVLPAHPRRSEWGATRAEWEGDIFVTVQAYTRTHADQRFWPHADADSRVPRASLVVDAVMPRVHTPTTIRIIPPFVV